MDTPHVPFSRKIFIGLLFDGPCECIGQIRSPEIIAIAVLGWVANIQS